jgi:hypothetical protein
VTGSQLPLDLGTFARGAVEYFDHYSGDLHPRIVVPIQLGNSLLPTFAVVDTGAPWCVLEPKLIKKLSFDVEKLQRVRNPLNIRGIAYSGWLYRIPMSLEASLGERLEIEATVFVPDLLPQERLGLFPISLV